MNLLKDIIKLIVEMVLVFLGFVAVGFVIYTLKYGINIHPMIH